MRISYEDILKFHARALTIILIDVSRRKYWKYFLDMNLKVFFSK